ncbi:cell wall metabolism sensor histidine kinase WalK [Paenibacillus sp. ACRRX]|uniref:cell wall metabolism sensor histidine kinase WalK n=1 Tax=unclassified Paenibacillus TaxID=185978 RepID=UPI001EF5544F|nr:MULTISPECIES: cell wall metabolism sensor histidine kinase WalK [unclassified Paenibacillus]MCG7408359.1 cell wall metabolism sensor histidine kinase WalK [Paenibacillus sp. ACRRX]MDK8181256.1 cell wall metabolism sensor histidine kinase WalK [Paenibacillus sp. UMB4589-SE434]
MAVWISRFLRTIQAKLIIIYVLLILIAMQLIGVYFVSTMKHTLTNNFTQELQTTTNFVLMQVGPKLDMVEGTDFERSREDLNAIVRSVSNMNGIEIQVLDATGKVLTTSSQPDDNYVGRKNTETVVNRALQGLRDNEEVIIGKDNERKKVLAQPIQYGAKNLGALYVVASMKDLYDTIDNINRIFLSGMAIALGLTAVLGIILAHTITQPIKDITKQATRVAEGNFEGQVPVLGNDEIGQLSEAFNDMTRRLQEALSVNEEEKEKLASILTNMSDGVLATDEHGRVIVMNKRASLMLRIRPAACEGKQLSALLGLSELELRERVEDKTNWMLLPVHAEEEGEADHDSILRVTFTPIHRRGEGITGTIVVLQDVTEQEKLDQSRREFVANVSHELRTPLTTIKSYVEALDDGALDEPQLAGRFVGVIHNETERMIRLVTDLLHLSRLDSKQAKIRMQPIEISELLEEVVDRFSFQFQNKHIQSVVQIEFGIPKVTMDRDQIDQVLDNLVSNAFKYTPEQGTITLSASITDDCKYVAIVVQDDGMGIPEKDVERIFERFYRVDKARSRNMGGTGLGLSIAREMVISHGGTIGIESEWNEGTCVTFTLPLSAPVSSAQPEETEGSEAEV